MITLSHFKFSNESKLSFNIYFCVYSKSRRRSSARRTSTLPTRTKQNRSDVGRDTLPVPPSTVGRTSRRARSCLDCRDPGTTLSRSAPDLFTISTSAGADRQRAVGNADSRCDDGRCHWYERCVDCGDRIAVAGSQLRPLMDTPV